MRTSFTPWMRQLVLKHQLVMKDSIASQQNITSLVDISRGKLEDPRLRLGVAFVIVQLDVPLTIQRKMMSSVGCTLDYPTEDDVFVVNPCQTLPN